MAKLGQVDLFTRRIRMAPPPKERAVHIAIADLLRVGAAPGWLWTHFPSGELRTEKTGALLKRMGVQAGWSDFLLVSPAGELHVLELKRRGSKPSEAQEQFLAEVGSRPRCHAAWTDHYEGAVEVLKMWGAISQKVHM